MVHCHFTALFAHSFYMDIYMKVKYRIFVTNYVRHNGKRTLIYKKFFFVLAFLSNELLTLMPAHLAYSASFPPRWVAFST